MHRDESWKMLMRGWGFGMCELKAVCLSPFPIARDRTRAHCVRGREKDGRDNADEG